MNLRDLKYIVAVAEFEHFGKAASSCFVSQPALSGQIRKVEEQLEIKLFERTKRSVRITEAGRQIVGLAKSILDQVEQIEDIASTLSDPFSGTLKIGMIPTIAPYLTPMLLPAMAHNLPKLDVQVCEEMTQMLEQKLIDGQIDVAILATPVQDQRFQSIPLYDEPFWVALPNQHKLVDNEEIDVHDIRLEEFLLLEDGHCFRDQVISFCEKVLDDSPKFKTQQTSLTTILALVGAGGGVTLVPAMSLSGSWVTDSGISLRREKTGTAIRSVVLTFRRSFHNQILLNKLADIICAVVPDTVSPVRR